MYSAESGALNESLSDIFGVIVSNYRGSRRRRLDLWNWEMGEDLDQTGGVAIRDIRHPELFGQPNHMDDYRNLPESEDHGGVHTNSGIHNRAGYLMLTSRRSPEHPTTLTPTEVAALYYLSVTQFLSRTSTFSDSRQGVILAAKSLFRNRADRDELIQVIESSFSGVGIE
jgi:Zn-dependent metalloprotease